MMLKALIVEQLEADGTLRTFLMQPSSHDGKIVVAFAGGYQDVGRRGPFHFLDESDEERFAAGFARCRARKLGTRSFRSDGSRFHVELDWSGVPTEAHWVSYYALSLPQHAIPEALSVRDPHNPSREYRRYVTRDDERQRYVVYLECVSKIGLFDFELSCDFKLDPPGFSTSSYSDAKTNESYGRIGDDWKGLLPEEEGKKVQQFFANTITMNTSYDTPRNATKSSNNPWVSGSFYLVCILSVLVAIRVIFGQMSPWFIPVVVAGGILVVSVIGALQLRNDERLKEVSFLKLMFKSLGYLPLLRTLLPHSKDAKAEQGESKSSTAKKDESENIA